MENKIDFDKLMKDLSLDKEIKGSDRRLFNHDILLLLSRDVHTYINDVSEKGDLNVVPVMNIPYDHVEIKHDEEVYFTVVDNILEYLLSKKINEQNVKQPTVIQGVINKSDFEHTKKDMHYNSSIQPIQFSQEILSHEQFEGAMLFTMNKYISRFGKKAGSSKLDEARKILNYATALYKHEQEKSIKPDEDFV